MFLSFRAETNYLDGHLEMKFRISSGNQQASTNISSKLTLDIGALYNAPIIFKHIVRYDNNKKIINNGLHQFTDFRAFVNFGYSEVLVYCEYRLFDFIIGNYPELPKYSRGLKFLMH